MAGLLEIVFGALGVIVGIILRLPRMVQWMEEDIDSRSPQSPLRRVPWLDGVLDAHQRISKRWAPQIMGPFFVLIGVGLLVVGIADLT
jgi:hypothetical protein